MKVEELLKTSREIWGEKKMSLSEIVVCMNVILGDIARVERDGGDVDGLKKELGNIVLSTIRWCDDLGYSPDECIEKAIEAQKGFENKND